MQTAMRPLTFPKNEPFPEVQREGEGGASI
jgi:hypothetical protein